MSINDIFCEHCGEKLDPETAVWLELSHRRNRFTDPAKGALHEEESQGCFPFGKACAATVLAAHGRNHKIRSAAR